VAASGFAMVNWALLLDREAALARVERCIDQTLKYNPARNRGWLYHFTDAEGRPRPDSEVSTIDTAIWLSGAGKAASLLRSPALIRKVDQIRAAIDVAWMRDGDYLRHGGYWRGDTWEPIPWTWDDYSEGVILYEAFGLDYEPRRISPRLPLFCYFYPLALCPKPEYVDRLRRAVSYQRATFRTWGVSACDSPEGYQVGRPDIVSPLALASIANLVPEAREQLATLPVPPTTPAYQPASGWAARDRIGIDDCAYVILQHMRVP
jgi:hypothetical protein